ncbi:aminotransferase [Loktanella sp. 3ANDIMAR09]|uniref:aspartate aminotransferase family protein n=1 Tax=Loktanella sp. 3ANDIMAR09 TaxID=1225657 RepID=UPI0006FD91B1|nr:aspartate aminotransferase family protein [Loktanella sp. 3ANDIMAR09]KQI67547.1 aminotransferase [Loktanella sp. 3ANDIMAR09]
MFENHLPTQELQALDAAHHLHPFTDGSALNKKGARVITAAKGVWLTDSDGNRILDAMAGLWCVNIGYGRPEMAEAAKRQIEQLSFYNTFFQTTHVPAVTLAAKLAQIAPGDLNHAHFANSGSEANDTNLRLVRHYWAAKGKPSKRVVIGRWNGYHGSTMGSGSLGGMKFMHAQGGMPIPDVAHIEQPDWWMQGGDSDPADFGLARARQLEEKILELGEDNVAAFIAEPIQGSGGVIVPPATYWPEIQRICAHYNVLLIADEVITGFGRTGKWFGSQTLDLRPDIMTIAKGMSSGYAPIGASLLSDDVANTINDAGEFNHGYTYAAHPLSAALALENIRILEDEKIVDHVANVAAPYLREKWEGLIDHPLVGDASIVGLMGSIRMTPDKAARAKFKSDEGTAGYICRERCFANNLVMRHVGDRMVISPPLVITKAEIDQFTDRAVQSLDETHAKLKADGLMVAA